MPKHLSVPGMCIAGDAAGLVNIPELKGIHYAMHAGMYAAEAIVEALKKDSVNFETYDKKVRASLIEEDLYRSRNMRQVFKHGFFLGGAIVSLMTITRALSRRPLARQRDAEHGVPRQARKSYPKPDNKYIFDKLSSVFASGNATRDDAPNHIRVQQTVATRGRARPWVLRCAPRRSTSSPRTRRERRRGDAQTSPVELRPIGAITAKGGRLTPPEGGERADVHARIALLATTSTRSSAPCTWWARRSGRAGWCSSAWRSGRRGERWRSQTGFASSARSAGASPFVGGIALLILIATGAGHGERPRRLGSPHRHEPTARRLLAKLVLVGIVIVLTVVHSAIQGSGGSHGFASAPRSTRAMPSSPAGVSAQSSAGRRRLRAELAGDASDPRPRGPALVTLLEERNSLQTLKPGARMSPTNGNRQGGLGGREMRREHTGGRTCPAPSGPGRRPATRSSRTSSTSKR
jgi:hypothetical protein